MPCQSRVARQSFPCHTAESNLSTAFEAGLTDHSSLTLTVSTLDGRVYFCFVRVYYLEPNHPKAVFCFVRLTTPFSDFYSAALTTIKSLISRHRSDLFSL